MTEIKRGDPPRLANVRSNIYHHYIRVDNPKSLIFLSGQLSRDSKGQLVGKGDMAEQTRQAIRNMQTVMEAAGGTLEDIVQLIVFTTDMRQFKEIVAARMEFFKTKLPTSTIVEVNHLADSWTARSNFTRRLRSVKTGPRTAGRRQHESRDRQYWDHHLR